MRGERCTNCERFMFIDAIFPYIQSWLACILKSIMLRKVSNPVNLSYTFWAKPFSCLLSILFTFWSHNIKKEAATCGKIWAHIRKTSEWIYTWTKNTTATENKEGMQSRVDKRVCGMWKWETEVVRTREKEKWNEE